MSGGLTDVAAILSCRVGWVSYTITQALLVFASRGSHISSVQYTISPTLSALFGVHPTSDTKSYFAGGCYLRQARSNMLSLL